MSVPPLLSLGALVLNGVLASYLIWRNPRSSAARLFVLLLAAFLLWAVPEFLLRLRPDWDPETLTRLVRVEWTGIALIPGLMAHFVLDYPRRSPLLERPWGLLALYTPSIVFATFLWGGDLLVVGVVPGPLGPSARVGPLYPVLGSLYAALILGALFHLGRAYARETDRRARSRYGVLVLGFGVPVLAGTVTEIYGPLLFQMPTRLGLGTVYTTIFTAFMVYAVFRYGLLIIEPAREPPAAQAFAGQQGQNYLFLEPGRRESFRAFRALVQEAPGLCVTAFPPSLLAETFGLHRVPILWLSSQESHPLVLKPIYLEVDVLQTLLRFLRDHPGSAVLWDDLEYLVHVNGTKAVLRTVSRVAAAASRHGSTLLANLHPYALDPEVTGALGAAFDRIERAESPEGSVPESLVPPGCVLWRGSREACFQALSRAALSRKTVVSTVYPEKLQTAYDLHDAAFLWVTSEPDGRYPSYPPGRLTLEVRRDVLKNVSEGSLVYLGELEVLVQEAGLLEVLEYVKQVVDAVVARGSLAVASVREGALSVGDLSTLAKRFAGAVG